MSKANGAAVRTRRSPAPDANWQEWISAPPVARESLGSIAGDATSGTDVDPSARRQRIELLAYLNWLARGCPHGSPEEDWFRAERQVDLEMSKLEFTRPN